jgi:tripartite-type tricarboxylate transporter receptor subunit TctC
MKPPAVTCGKRDPGAPNVPTFAAAGVVGYDARFWCGLLARTRGAHLHACRSRRGV